MTSRYLPTSSHPIAFSPPPMRATSAPAGWTRKTFALAMHMGCLALFWTLVVSPVVTPILTGELQREFMPLLQAWSDWTSGGHAECSRRSPQSTCMPAWATTAR